jgi:hypothetical protein
MQPKKHEQTNIYLSQNSAKIVVAMIELLKNNKQINKNKISQMTGLEWATVEDNIRNNLHISPKLQNELFELIELDKKYKYQRQDRKIGQLFMFDDD